MTLYLIRICVSSVWRVFPIFFYAVQIKTLSPYLLRHQCFSRDSTLNAAPMALESRRELGVYTEGYNYSCKTKGFGKTIRLFITDSYFDSKKYLAQITDTTKLEAENSGGALLFSTPVNSDGTMQFTYNGDTVDAKLDPFRFPMSFTPHLDATFLTADCVFMYSP